MTKKEWLERHNVRPGGYFKGRIDASRVVGVIGQVYPNFFLVYTDRGYTTTVARWHMMRAVKDDREILPEQLRSGPV